MPKLMLLDPGERTPAPGSPGWPPPVDEADVYPAQLERATLAAITRKIARKAKTLLRQFFAGDA